MTKVADQVDTLNQNVSDPSIKDPSIKDPSIKDPSIKDTSLLLMRLLWAWGQHNGRKFSRWMWGLVLFLIMSGTTTGYTYGAMLTNRLGTQWAQVRQFFLQRYNLE